MIDAVAVDMAVRGALMMGEDEGDGG